MRILYIVLVVISLVCVSPTMAQGPGETVTYSLEFVNVENVNGQWLDDPVHLSLDNVIDHMTVVKPTGDCIQYLTVAKLDTGSFVVVDYIYCPAYYEAWNVDMVTFRDLRGNIFDF